MTVIASKETKKAPGSRVAGIYAVAVGLGMVGLWTMLLVTGQVPELESEPWSIGLHLAAEFLTAMALLVGGYGLLQQRRWARGTYLFAAGMLFYTLVQSPGYYLDRGESAFAWMFAGLAGAGALATAHLLLRSRTRTPA